ncbi:uncharacterized protein LOC110254650 [Exaiptasia diaphana]|uniref:Uncharacterized protein n=1 Tax=Exaiptasia diaphana TaxID=2652724 RepID=A0A913YAI2_EXADI|nr:uncharacterized protein LOC110254650 [Exaiptasia diaphana]KXJ28320.1 hypothetical protein AC249_AIPGENE5768 [Exaiptasia diaphana]
MISKYRILAFCLLLAAIVSTAIAGSDNDLLETLMAGIQVKEKLLPGERPSNESENIIFSLSNRGILENSLANLNLMHSLELQEAFQRVRDATAGQVKCKTFTSPSIVVFKLCALNSTTNEITGSYSSNIKITKAVRYTNNERVISYVLSVMMSVSVSPDIGKYERCAIEDPSWLEQQYTHQQTLDKSHYYGDKDKKKDKVYEFMMPSVQYITVAMLREPSFFRIVLTEPPNTNDKIDVCHDIVEHPKQDTFNVKPENCTDISRGEKRTIMKNFDESVTLKFEEDEQTFSMLLYDSSIQDYQLENVHQRKEKSNDPRYLQLFGLSKHNIPKKLSYERMSNGKVFTFTFDSDNQTIDSHTDMSAHQLIVFIQENSTNSDEHHLEKASKYVAEKKQVKKPKKSEQVRQDVLNWLMTGNMSFDHLYNQKEYTKIPAKCPKKQLTCGIVVMEMVRKKTVKNSLMEIPLLTMFLTTKFKMNQNGKALGQSDLRFLQRQLSIIKGKGHHYDVLLEMNPELMSRVKRIVLYVKRSITSKFGAKVWKSFFFSSELMITRRLNCNNEVCDGTIRAMFQYNITRIPLQKRLTVHTPRGIRIKLSFTFNRQQQQQQQQQQLPRQPQIMQKHQLPQQQKKQLSQQKRPIQAHHRQQQQMKLSSPQKDVFTSKLFFKPVARASKNRDDKLKKIDMFSQGKEIHPRHFKIDKKHLSNKETKMDGLVQVIADGLKKYNDDLERFTKEQMKIMKERASKSSGCRLGVNLFIVGLVVMNGWLLLSQ